MGFLQEKKHTPAEEKRSSLTAKPGMFVDKFSGSFFSRYKGLKVLGKGASGEVILCLDRVTKQELAVKIISKKNMVNEDDAAQILKEVELLKQLDHPNIMKVYEYFEDKRYLYVVGEVYTGGELFDAIVNKKRFSEADAARIIRQVLSGVTFMHQCGIVHRDLKPENLVLESPDPDANIRIIDFGLSTHYNPSKKMRDKLGTAYYIAPEVLKGKYDERCDVWSVGVILYLLLSGMPPFNGATEHEILKRVEKGSYSFEGSAWKSISESARDLIKKMLKYSVTDRITAKEALAHPWFAEVLDNKSAKLDLPTLESSIGNMRQFQNTRKLTQAALLYVASRLTTKADTQKLRQIFEKMDKNHDGRLDKEELIAGYVELAKLKGDDVSHLDRSAIAAEVDEVLRAADMDNSGVIEWSEFITIHMDQKTLLSKQNVQLIFNKFDKDGSGKISGEEIAAIFGTSDMPSDVMRSLINEADKDDDGEVDFEEFFELLTRHLS